MRAAAISRIKISDADAHDDKFLCKQHLFALLYEKRMYFYFMHIFSENVRLLTICLNQQASGVDHTSGIRAIFEVTHNTPPPGRYIYIKRYKKKKQSKGGWREEVEDSTHPTRFSKKCW
jgi:hypothetical protein